MVIFGAIAGIDKLSVFLEGNQIWLRFIVSALFLIYTEVNQKRKEVDYGLRDTDRERNN